ncbi:MAG: hypothetical protein HY537_00335 [Deltaproteobacteria bacterium]|nr:hypothetical protein [Deltaproteobacteria bacterium]
MKRSIVTLGFAVLALTTISAKAFNIPVLPGQERATRYAVLTEIDRQQKPIVSPFGVTITLLSKYNEHLKLQPFAFIVTEDMPVNCRRDPRCPPLRKTMIFTIRSHEFDFCGNSSYTAEEKTTEPIVPKKLGVTDHSNRVCENYFDHDWEITLFDVGNDRERYFHGNSKALITVQ